MLFNNRICNLQAQKIKATQQLHLESILDKADISTYLTLKGMFLEDSDLALAYAREAYRVLYESGNCKVSDFKECYEQLATYGLALSGLFFAYNKKSGRFDLYTSSYSILMSLATKNVLVGRKGPIHSELETFRNALVTGGRLANSIKKGDRIQVVRLDAEMQGKRVIFKGVVPRSQLVLSEYHIVPYQVVDLTMGYFNNLLQDKALKFEYDDGESLVLTRNVQLLSMVYGEKRTNYYGSIMYNPKMNKFVQPVLGDSMYSSGVRSVNLCDISKVSEIKSISDVDLSDVKVDISGVKDFLLAKVDLLDMDTLKILAEGIELEMLQDRVLAIMQIKELIRHTRDEILYHIIRKYPKEFDLQGYRALPSKWGSVDVEQVDIPLSVASFNEMLRQGVYKIGYTNRKGNTLYITCTNNDKALKQIYGDDYFTKYESAGNRLRRLDFIVKKKTEGTGSLTLDSLYNICIKYNLEVVVEGVMQSTQLFDKTDTVDYQTVKKSITEQLYCVDMQKTVIKNPKLVTVRNCECRADVEDSSTYYYRSLDLNSVVSILKIV